MNDNEIVYSKAMVGDLLTDTDVAELTGVNKNSRNKNTKVIAVLKKAGIFFWIKNDGSIGTRWHHVHHVHQAGKESIDEKSLLPKFSCIK